MTSTYLSYSVYAKNFDKTLAQTAAEPTVARDQAYYEANIGKVTTVDQFVNNYRLFTYAMKAMGLADIGNAKALMKKVLESDLSNSKSFANSLSDTRYREFAKAFQFTTTGEVASTAASQPIAQTSAQTSDTTALFAKVSTATATAKAAATTYYTGQIGSVSDVKDLVGNPKLLAYVESAYGIQPTTSAANLTAALESDLSDSKSFANTTSIKGLKALAADFNFGTDGKISPQRQLQSAADIAATTTAYLAAVGSSTAETAETTYYKTTLPTLTSLDGFLSNKRLVAYAEKAYGLSESTSTTQLEAILTSNVNSATSVADKEGAAALSFAAAFNVGTDGKIVLTPDATAQSKSGVASVTSAYLEQTIEDEAEQSNPGVKLALYFRAHASTITNAYQILADKTLTQFVQTTLGLSSTSSKADIDSQARTITDKLNLADLKDPEKVDKLIARFSALYDSKNATTSATSIFSV